MKICLSTVYLLVSGPGEGWHDTGNEQGALYPRNVTLEGIVQFGK